MNPRPWAFLDSGIADAAVNMAADEALLEALPKLGHPILRFYGWSEPAASFGYSQRYEEVASLTQLRPLVRRSTGGGLVCHDSDWTYSVAFPAGDPWYALDAASSYQRVHQWLQSALGMLEVSTELAEVCSPAGPGQCFVGHEKFDLLWRGKKIAGAAQRRSRNGLLIQGSLQAGALMLARANWQAAMLATGETLQGAQWQRFKPEQEWVRRVAELARSKFGAASYNRRR